jgi:hypothetical protein
VKVCEPATQTPGAAVVNDQVLDAAAGPKLFFATTFQWYVALAASAILTA